MPPKGWKNGTKRKRVSKDTVEKMRKYAHCEREESERNRTRKKDDESVCRRVSGDNWNGENREICLITGKVHSWRELTRHSSIGLLELMKRYVKLTQQFNCCVLIEIV